jgi:cell fate regulator YaaT (PSP1 superfamily)
LNRLDLTFGAERMAALVASERAHIHTIVPVHFERTRKTLYFYSGTLRVKAGDGVLVDASRGINWGEVVAAPVRTVSDGREYGRVVRLLSREEESRLAASRRREHESSALCREISRHMGLQLKVVDVEFTTSSNKAIFYFTADERVDFRELVRELARHLRMTIEMRQIGARDETKILGGMGPCGLETCCAGHLNDFAPVTIKMAKNQDLALNPQKVSGLCGRLFCCLAYEDPVYTELKKGVPKRDSIVRTPDGVGRAYEVDIFKRRVKVAISGRDHEWYPLEKLEVGSDGDREAVLSAEGAAREQRAAAIEAQRERLRHFEAGRHRGPEKADRGEVGEIVSRDLAGPADGPPRPEGEAPAPSPAGEGPSRRRDDRERGRDRSRDRDRGRDPNRSRQRPAPQGPRGQAPSGAERAPGGMAPASEAVEGGAVPVGLEPDAGGPPPAEGQDGMRREGPRRKRRRRRRSPRDEGGAPGTAGQPGAEPGDPDGFDGSREGSDDGGSDDGE